jgi:two-component system response regulator HydG
MHRSSPRILIVDDDASHRTMLRATLTAEQYEVFEADDGSTAIEMAKNEPFDLILMDIRMHEVGGVEALQEIKRNNPAIPVIMMTAYASVETAVQTLKDGAYDYLTKPLDTEELLITIAKALDHFQLKVENQALRERLAERFDFSRIVGQSKSMRDVFELLALAAPSEATILITGESGTGKELIANAVHQNSPRADKPFIKVNCAALPENLLESELFGHEKGAFTGATSRRLGRFELAHGGTLFLDEIGDMSNATQAKILRVLQEGEFERLGSEKTIRVDVRILAATNKDLEQEIEAGRFRKDLFYRLSVVPIHIPPLRERKEDIPLLAEHFLKTYAEKNRRLIRGFTPEAMTTLMRYAWPGNIRELENAVERAVIMCRGEFISPDDLPANLKALVEQAADNGIGVQPGYSLREVEKELILKTLEQTGGNRTRAAEILGVTRQTLQKKLKEYDIGR